MEMDVLAAHEEIRGAVEYHHSEGLVESGDRWMLGGVLDLSEMDVSEVMVHRKQIVTLDAELTPRETLNAALASSHSRLPIYRDDPEGHGQWTVVTGRYGALRGRRIVRGWESDCEAYYAQQPANNAEQELFSLPR